jgi:hypothetical protein
LLFKRRRTTRETRAPGQVVAELQSDVDRFSALRLPLYLNEKRIADTFELWRNPITEVLTSSELGAEMSASAVRLFELKGSKKISASETIELTPMLRVRLLEGTAREKGRLVDLASAEPRKAALLTFVGEGHLVLPETPLDKVRGLRLTAEDVAALQKERERWQAIHQAYERGGGRTMVWVASGRRPLASIFGIGSVNWGWLDSHGNPPYGVLGLYGNTVGSVVLVTSLFIWHEQKSVEAS